MPEYIRSKTAGGLYFFTVVTFGRRQFLTSSLACGILRQAWKDVRDKHEFAVEAICILPEHLHCIWRLPEGDDADFEKHFHYIHYNPVKHGHVTRPQEWKWSSFHRYRRLGYYEAGWGCDGLDSDADDRFGE